ncbi:MAG: MarR family transcriptional regulator [Pseudolabrys sp.]
MELNLNESAEGCTSDTGLQYTAVGDADLSTQRILNMPGHLIRRLHQASVSIFARATKNWGITPVQYATLVAAMSKPGVDQCNLAQTVAFDKATIGDVIKRLEARGLINRSKGSRDRRAKQVFITEPGRALLSEVDAVILEAQRDILAPLSEDERRVFLSLLGKLVLNEDEEQMRALRDK